MTKLRFLLPCFMLTVIVLVFSACNSIPEHTKYIPKDAMVVGSVDMKQLGKKIVWNAITGSKLFKKMEEKAGQKKATTDLEATGVDLASRMYMYVEHGNDPYSRVVYLTPLKDAAKLEGFLKQNFTDAQVEDHTQYKSARLNDNTIAGWNKDVLMVIMMNATDSMATIPSFADTDTDMDADTDAAVASADTAIAATAVPAATSDYFNEAAVDSVITFLKRPVPVEALNAALTRAFSIKSDSSIMAISQFKDLQKAGHDVTLWFNPNSLYSTAMAGNPMASSFVKPEDFKDLYMSAGVNFEKGKISAEMVYYVNDKLKDLYEAFGKDKIDMDMLERLPNKNADVMLAYKINFEAIKKALQQFKLDGLANLGLAAAGFSLDEVLKAFKGDLVIALSDIKSKQTEIDLSDSTSYTHVTPDVKVIVAASVGDKKAIEKMFSKFGAESFTQQSGGYYQMGTDSSTNVFLNDKYMIFSSDRSATEAYLNPAGAKGELPELVRSHFKGNPSGVYVNLAGIFNYMLLDPYQKQKTAITTLTNTFDKVVGWGGSVSNKKMKYNAELQFKSKDENSLIILIDMADKLSEQYAQESLPTPQANATTTPVNVQ